MTGQPDELATPSGPDRQDAVRHAAVALRSMGQPNSVTGEFDFWDNSYEGRRLFSELLGTFFLVLVAVGVGMVNARFGGDAVPSGAVQTYRPKPTQTAIMATGIARKMTLTT